MGLFISLDGGANWMRSKYQNMPWYNMVRDIKIHPKTNDLVLATHGRGIIVVDDISPMRMLGADIANKEVHIFSNEPVKLTSGNFGGGSLGGDAGREVIRPLYLLFSIT